MRAIWPSSQSVDGVDDQRDVAVFIRDEEIEEHERKHESRERDEVRDGENLVRRIVGSADKLLLDLFLETHVNPLWPCAQRTEQLRK